MIKCCLPWRNPSSQLVSSRSVCFIQNSCGLGVQPPKWTRRVFSSMTKSKGGEYCSSRYARNVVILLRLHIRCTPLECRRRLGSRLFQDHLLVSVTNPTVLLIRILFELLVNSSRPFLFLPIRPTNAQKAMHGIIEFMGNLTSFACFTWRRPMLLVESRLIKPPFTGVSFSCRRMLLPCLVGHI